MRSGIRVGSGRRRDGIGTRVHSPHLASRTASFSAAHSPHSGAQPLFPNPPSWRTEPVAPPSASWEAAWRSQSPPGQLPGFHHSAFPWDRSDPQGVGPKLRQKTSEEQSAGWSGPNNRRPEPRSGLLGPPASALCRGNFWDPSHLAGHEASGTIIGAKSAKGGGHEPTRPGRRDQNSSCPTGVNSLFLWRAPLRSLSLSLSLSAHQDPRKQGVPQTHRFAHQVRFFFPDRLCPTLFRPNVVVSRKEWRP